MSGNIEPEYSGLTPQSLVNALIFKFSSNLAYYRSVLTKLKKDSQSLRYLCSTSL